MENLGQFEFAYLVKLQRNARAAELLHSIQRPTQELAELVVSMSDVDALAIAFEQSTADQAARWVALMLNFDPELVDDANDNDLDEDDDEDLD